MDGDTTEYGYNLALSLRPLDNWNIGVTYRSKVNLNLSTADVKLNANIPGILERSYDGHGEVDVPVPAVVTIGTSYTIKDTTVEISWDRTFWSKYDHLDFEYSQDLSGDPFLHVFDDSVEKDWRNSDTYRIGLTHKCTERFTAMLGFAIDSNPVPEKTLGFELPDSDAKIYSIGGKYNYSDNLSIGASYFYYDKESRDVTNSNGINGEFSEAGAHVANIGINYTF
jgi:long-chain fatty acid transport protein